MTKDRKDFDAKGKFAKGNQARKTDMTKEIAKNMVSKELWWIAKLMCDSPQSEIKQMIKKGVFEDESIMINILVKKVAGGDMKALQWFAEMMVGKATQQVETKITEHTMTINIDGDDALM